MLNWVIVFNLLVVPCATFVATLRLPRTFRMSTLTMGPMLTTTGIASNGRTFQNLGMPRLLPPNGGRGEWMMWLHARDEDFEKDVVSLSTGRILHATSLDGLTDWKFHPDSPVLNPNKENGGDWFFFDSEHVGLGDIIQPGDSAMSKFAIQDGRAFLMYIFGGCADEVTLEGPKGPTVVKGVKMEIGVAVSQDGVHWSRIEGPEPYGSILTAGKTDDEFDSQFVGWPNVMEVGSEYRMYYSTFDTKLKKFVIGLAMAKDGLLKWSKKGPVFAGADSGNSFDSKGASRRHMVKLDDKSWKMWYEGVSADGVHSIGCATSEDGIVWKRVSDSPVLAPSTEANAWDGGGVGSPNVIWMPDKKRWRMYYVGNEAHKGSDGSLPPSSIGVAESLDEDGLIFERITI